MNRLSFAAVLVLTSLTSVAPAFAGLASLPLGSANFTATGSLSCGKTTDGGVVCAQVVEGVTVTRLSSTAIRFSHDTADVVVDVQGTELIVERGDFSNGERGVRIRGAITGVQATKLGPDGPLSTASFAYEDNSTLGSLLVIEAGIGIDIVETGITGPRTERAWFDRGGIVMGTNGGTGWQWSLDHGAGLTRFAGVNGVVRFNRGGVLVDPTTSSMAQPLQDWLVVHVPEWLGGNEWDLVERPLGGVTIHRLGGNEWDFTLDLHDRDLRQAVIGGVVYPFE